jgi:signal transduction histidine kinase
VEASDIERRRIARDLHDGVVQNLAGVSYTLSAAAMGVREGSRLDAAPVIDRAAGEVRDSIRELRTLLVDIYPPTLRRAGLDGAISDLAAPLAGRDVEVEISLAPNLGLAPEREAILYRVAQEALRNVAKHADASHVRVHAARRNGTAMLTVEDDGRGFVHGESHRANGNEHFGLRILEDLARDAGGRLTVQSSPGAGTRVSIEVPAA